MSFNRNDAKAKIVEFLKIPAARVQEDSPLVDLVAESFMLIEMVIELQEAFSLRLNREELEEIKTVGQLLDLLQEKSAAAVG
ncbi:MAG: acyl carrier protein [Bdellovibrionia bacterium]